VRNLTFYYDSVGIKWINITTSLNNSYTKGVKTNTQLKSEHLFTVDRPLIGFWGTNGSALINSLSNINVDANCASPIQSAPAQPP
jgi:hypothetical protein